MYGRSVPGKDTLRRLFLPTCSAGHHIRRRATPHLPSRITVITSGARSGSSCRTPRRRSPSRHRPRWP